MSDAIVATLEIRIVPIDVSLLLELGVLRSLKLSMNFDEGSPIRLNVGWSDHCVHKFGELYDE